MDIKYIQILNSQRREKKYKAIFYNSDRFPVKTTHFGSKTGNTYNCHHDDDIKTNWLARHEVNGTFDDFVSASALSRWLLWNRPSLSASFKHYLKKFNLKEY